MQWHLQLATIYYYYYIRMIVVHARLVTLHDGSPLIGRESISATGKLVTEFLGIPFAEPPIGRLRFRKPEPKRAWRTPLNASSLSASCVQSSDKYFGDFYGANMWNANTPTSEDCLYLNVFVPGHIDANARLAVLVWIYGGGFWSGTATLDIYDGKIFAAEENVIIVSMNYRVSVLGFIYLGREDAPGNMGLWDQLMAIRWVRSNIDVFGGDADSITLFGESAGAASVSMHMLSAHSTPYFRRAIVQSGSATAPWAIESREVALPRPVAMYEAMRCDGTNGNMSHRDPDSWNFDAVIACLRDAPVQRLLDHEWSPVMEFADFPWVPVIDGDFLVEQPATSLRQGRFKATELLAGSNHDEAIYFIVYQLADVFPPAEFFSSKDFVKSRDVWLRSVLNLLPRNMVKSSMVRQAIIHEYEPYSDAPSMVSPAAWLDAMDKMLGDLQFTCSVNELALAHSTHGGATYYYYFTHRATEQTWPAWMGVLHGYEINFVFGEPFNVDRFSYTAEERELSRRFMRYWANFARTGNPNRNPDGTYMAEMWPQYTSQTMEYINLTIESDYTQRGAGRLGHGPRRKQCAFWKSLLPNLMSAVADMTDASVRWKQQLDRWQNEYIVDWQLHFEQYKRYQVYRRADQNDGQCNNNNN